MADEEDNDVVNLKLGDIILIESPTDQNMHNKMYLITYIDKDGFDIMGKDRSTSSIVLQDGVVFSSTITNITIVNHAKEEGYCRQNGLNKGVWVSIYFLGEFPTITTGEIVEQEDDWIGIKTSTETIYINFNYMGIPKDLLIDKIVIIDPPTLHKKSTSPLPISASDTNTNTKLEKATESSAAPIETENVSKRKEGVEMQKSFELQKSFESQKSVELPQLQDEKDSSENEKQLSPIVEGDESNEEKTPDEEFGINVIKNIEEENEEVIYYADQIVFTEVDVIKYQVEVDESERKYNIESQTDDLLEDLLSTIPNDKRNNKTLNSIHTMIERYIQLRNEFSKINNDGTLGVPDMKGNKHKPLLESVKQLNKSLPWIVPVVKNVKKLYDIEEQIDSNDIIFNTSLGTKDQELLVNENYKNDKIEGDDKFNQYINSLKPFYTPFDRPNVNEECLHTQAIENESFNTIVYNMSNYKSYVAKNFEVKHKQYMNQPYINGDEMCIKSIMTLPKSAVEYSRIHLPSTNLLKKSNLNRISLSHSQMFNSKTDVKTIGTTDENILDKDTFLSAITDYVYIPEDEKDNDKDKVYDEYLNKIIPDTSFLINTMKNKMDGNISVHNFVKKLEPFLIYNRDLSAKHYDEIENFIYNEIENYKDDYHYKRNKMEQNTFISSNRPFLNVLFDGLLNDKNTEENIKYMYNLKNLNLTDSEILHYSGNIDNAYLLNLAIANRNSSLLLSTKIDDMIKISAADEEKKSLQGGSGEEKSVDSTEKKAPEAADCKKYVLSKKYISLDELEEDNDIDIHFDKTYDKTLYGLVSEYKKELDSISTTNEKIDFLSKKLSEKVGLKEDDSMRDAEAMIVGKRKVVNGDYAVLIIGRGKDAVAKYYVRSNNKWVEDNTISSDLFTDKSKVFCNINEKCISIKDKCEKIEKIEEDVNNENEKLVANTNANGNGNGNANANTTDFDSKISLTSEQISQMISERVKKQMIRTGILNEMQKKHNTKHTNKKYNIGLLLGEEKNIIATPYTELRNLILNYPDIVKRQTFILDFIKVYTRVPTSSEDKWWLYCVTTNTKLLPVFIQRMAVSFIKGWDAYNKEIQSICKTQGTLSDDGDSWVDKYSGFIIKKVDFDTEEGYTEEGFKVKSRAVLEELNYGIEEIEEESKEMIDVYEEALIESSNDEENKMNDDGENEEKTETIVSVSSDNKKDIETMIAEEDKIKVTEEYKKIVKIVSSISNSIRVNLNGHMNFILSCTQRIYDLNKPTEEEYKKMTASMQAKASVAKATATATATAAKIPQPESYTAYIDKLLIYLTLSNIFICIQSNIPSIKVSKPYPGCKLSYDGYPLGENKTNISGIEYIACIVFKLKQQKESTFNSIKDSVKLIASNMKGYIDVILKLNSEAKNKLEDKRKYLKSLDGIEVEDELKEHNITKWVNFLPVFNPMKTKDLKTVSDNFVDDLLNDMKNGKEGQQEKLDIIRSKIMFLTVGIQEHIQKSVSKFMKDYNPILVNNMNEPYLENACCSDGEKMDTFTYFARKEPSIELFNRNVDVLQSILLNAHKRCAAMTLFDPRDTRGFKMNGQNGFSQNTMYNAFISNCEMIPSLKDLCSNKNDRDREKKMIDYMKNNSNMFDKTAFEKMMVDINNKNIVHLSKTEELQKPHLFASTSELSPSLQTIKELLDRIHVGDKEGEEELENYLAEENNVLIRNITRFIKKYLKKKEFDVAYDCITNMMNFKENVKDDDESIHKMVSFFKNAAESMVVVFPNMIKNGVSNNLNRDDETYKRWKLSLNHINDLNKMLDSKYEPINIKDDVEFNNINFILKSCKTTNDDVLFFIKNTFFKTSLIQANSEVQANSGIQANTSSDATSKSNRVSSPSENKIMVNANINKKSLLKMLMQFYFLSILSNIMNVNVEIKERKSRQEEEKEFAESSASASASSSSAVADINRPLIKNNKSKKIISSRKAAALEIEKEYGDLLKSYESNIDIMEGNIKSLEKYKTSIIQKFLEMLCSSKKKINYNYDSLMERIIKSKNDEKKRITDRLDKMSDDERKLSNIQRMHGLGEWGKGSGREYTKERYDEEVLEMSTSEILDEWTDMSNIGDDGEEQYENENMYGESDDY